MADVEISYNNSVIASLSDSGTEVLETNGTFMSDDITVTYTSPGGGGGPDVVTSAIHGGGGIAYYSDDEGVLHKSNLDPMTGITASLYVGAVVACLINTAPESVSNLSLIYTVNLGARANYKYLHVYQATSS